MALLNVITYRGPTGLKMVEGGPKMVERLLSPVFWIDEIYRSRNKDVAILNNIVATRKIGVAAKSGHNFIACYWCENPKMFF